MDADLFSFFDSGCRSLHGVGRRRGISLLGGAFGVREHQGCFAGFAEEFV